MLGEFEALKPQAKVEGQLPVILENCASSVKEKGTGNWGRSNDSPNEVPTHARPSKLASHAGPQSGSAALPCGKPAAFRPMPTRLSSSAQAGRLSLPACAEEVVQGAGTSERRSLSANQAAEPQVVVDTSEANLAKPATHTLKLPLHQTPLATQHSFAGALLHI